MESSSGICDKNGNVLFYTNGDTIWNRKHQLLKNWQPTFPYLTRTSARQGTIILPVPGTDSLYYLFTGRSRESNNLDSMLRYWTIDMRGDNGLGEVVEKEKPLLLKPNEAFATTLHANKKDYWISIISPYTKKFQTIRTVNGNFTAPPITQNVTVNSFYDAYATSLKFSPDSKLLCGNLSGTTANNPFLNIYPFDNNTGTLSTPVKIPMSYSSAALSLEFSADSRFLYVGYYDYLDFTIAQYDLIKLNAADIIASKVILYKVTSPASGPNDCEIIPNLQLGPDGKIYCFNRECGKISVISSPQTKGFGCNFQYGSFDLASKFNASGGPYYPNFWFRKDSLYLGKDTIICKGDSLLLDTKLITYGRRFLWNTGDSTSSIIIHQPGTYIVKVIYPMNRTLSDTIIVKYSNKFKVFLGNDTAFCKKFSYPLNAGPNFKKYTWNTKDSTMQITVNQQGIYSVRVIDSNACPIGDTIKIDEVQKPNISLVKDTISCKSVALSVNRQANVTYQWNTGDSGITTVVSAKGIYIITASNQFCKTMDTVVITELPKPEINLGPDTVICHPIDIIVNEKGQFVWSNGSKDISIKIQSPGIYWLKISRNNCSSSDTLKLTPCDSLTYFIPDAFSPNNDMVNDIFTVTGKNINNVELSVYNRWGELIAVDTGITASWDGMYMNRICQEGVYFYMIHLTGYNSSHVVHKYLKGSFNLLR